RPSRLRSSRSRLLARACRFCPASYSTAAGGPPQGQRRPGARTPAYRGAPGSRIVPPRPGRLSSVGPDSGPDNPMSGPEPGPTALPGAGHLQPVQAPIDQPPLGPADAAGAVPAEEADVSAAGQDADDDVLGGAQLLERLDGDERVV